MLSMLLRKGLDLMNHIQKEPFLFGKVVVGRLVQRGSAAAARGTVLFVVVVVVAFALIQINGATDAATVSNARDFLRRRHGPLKVSLLLALSSTLLTSHLSHLIVHGLDAGQSLHDGGIFHEIFLPQHDILHKGFASDLTRDLVVLFENFGEGRDRHDAKGFQQEQVLVESVYALGHDLSVSKEHESAKPAAAAEVVLVPRGDGNDADGLADKGTAFCVALVGLSPHDAAAAAEVGFDDALTPRFKDDNDDTDHACSWR
jgi:hypothetical protein